MNVVDRFRAQAEARPDTLALVEGRRQRRRVTTFAELDRMAAEGAGRLAEAGVGAGDRVLVLVPVSARLYGVLAAVFRAGAVAVVVDPGAGVGALAAAVARVQPTAFVGTPRAHALRLGVRAVRQIPTRFVVGGWVPGARRWEGGAPAPVVDVGPDAPALLTFTSGTTGVPKAAVRTHGLLAAQHAALAAALDLRPDDVDLATLPVVVLATLASGVTTVLADADLRRPGAVDAGRVLRQMADERVTRCVASPAFFERLLAHPEADVLRGLRRIDAGGGPVFPGLLARLGDRAGAVYGSTEAEPIAELSAGDLTEADRARVGAGEGLPVGRPVSAVDLRVQPDRWGEPLGPFSVSAWEARALAPGETGEIVVAGDHVVPGYLDGEGDAETKVEVGGRRWHRTGDAGRLDADGRLWLLGRCAAASRRDGAAVYPLQVEAALRERLDCRAAFVDLDGRRVVAVEGGPTAGVADAVPWAALDAVVAVPRLPVDRRHNAKVDLAALRTMLRAR